jgi:hypothetical protein
LDIVRSSRHEKASVTFPAGARLVDLALPCLAIKPKPVGDHPVPQRLARQRQLVDLAQLLGCQRRPEIGIALPDRRHRLGPDRCWIAPVARASTTPRCQSRRARGSKNLQQPENLPNADAKSRRRIRWRHPVSLDIPKNADTPKFLAAHHHQRHPTAPQNPQKRVPEMTSLSCATLTFTFCAYSSLSRNFDFWKTHRLAIFVTLRKLRPHRRSRTGVLHALCP